MTNLQIFKEEYTKGMKYKQFHSFMETFPTLLNVITKSMKRVELRTLDNVLNTLVENPDSDEMYLVEKLIDELNDTRISKSNSK